MVGELLPRSAYVSKTLYLQRVVHISQPRKRTWKKRKIVKPWSSNLVSPTISTQMWSYFPLLNSLLFENINDKYHTNPFLINFRCRIRKKSQIKENWVPVDLRVDLVSRYLRFTKEARRVYKNVKAPFQCLIKVSCRRIRTTTTNSPGVTNTNLPSSPGNVLIFRWPFWCRTTQNGTPILLFPSLSV